MVFAKLYVIDDEGNPDLKDVVLFTLNERLSLQIGEAARKECIKRGYDGYRIFKGETIANSVPVSGFWPVPSKPDRSAAAAFWGA